MSGHNRAKKDGHRAEKARKARARDFEQPVLRSVTKERAQATSNFTDGRIAGPDWHRKEHAKKEE
jgi:hypothetical protein